MFFNHIYKIRSIKGIDLKFKNFILIKYIKVLLENKAVIVLAVLCTLAVSSETLFDLWHVEICTYILNRNNPHVFYDVSMGSQPNLNLI